MRCKWLFSHSRLSAASSVSAAMRLALLSVSRRAASASSACRASSFCASLPVGRSMAFLSSAASDCRLRSSCCLHSDAYLPSSYKSEQ
jgi:hypothetical protein